MENRKGYREKRKKKELEEKKQKRISKGLTTLRALSDFSRIIGLVVKGWNYFKEYFSDLFL